MEKKLEILATQVRKGIKYYTYVDSYGEIFEITEKQFERIMLKIRRENENTDQIH